jgi:hypothetical protein
MIESMGLVEMTHFVFNMAVMKKVKKVQKALGNANLGSRAIVSGFVNGFSLPIAFFFHRETNFPSKFDTSPERAWADVGRTMRGVMLKGTDLDNGKSTTRGSTKRRIAA